MRNLNLQDRLRNCFLRDVFGIFSFVLLLLLLKGVFVWPPEPRHGPRTQGEAQGRPLGDLAALNLPRPSGWGGGGGGGPTVSNACD